MKTTFRSVTCASSLFPRVRTIVEVGEVHPESQHTIRLTLSLLDDGRFAVWSTFAILNADCTPPQLFGTESEARRHMAELAAELDTYAYPVAKA